MTVPRALRRTPGEKRQPPPCRWARPTRKTSRIQCITICTTSVRKHWIRYHCRGVRLSFTIVRCRIPLSVRASRPSIILWGPILSDAEHRKQDCAQRCVQLESTSTPSSRRSNDLSAKVQTIVQVTRSSSVPAVPDIRYKPARMLVLSNTTSENWSWTWYWRQTTIAASPHPLARNRPRTEVASTSYLSIVVRSISRVFNANCIFFFCTVFVASNIDYAIDI